MTDLSFRHQRLWSSRCTGGPPGSCGGPPGGGSEPPGGGGPPVGAGDSLGSDDCLPGALVFL